VVVVPMSKILAWHGNPMADGSAYYRMLLPLKALAESLPRTDIKFSNTVYPEHLDWADILIGQRVAKMELATEWVQWAARRSPRLVYDLDDDLLNVDPKSPAYGAYGPYTNRAALQWAMGSAHHLVVSTQALADRMDTYNTDIRVAPNCVPSWLLGIKRPDHAFPVVGWAGSATHEADIATVHNTLTMAAERLGCVWHTIGGRPWWSAGVCRFEYRHDEWMPGVEAYLHQVDFDICVIPLAETTFNESKSDIKAREMAALGIPVVAADHPVYRDTVINGVTGYLYKSQAGLMAALQSLVHSRSLREGLGAGARRLAEAEFMIDNPKNLQRWSSALLRERA
jgi:Glycosyl transferases group 1